MRKGYLQRNLRVRYLVRLSLNNLTQPRDNPTTYRTLCQCTHCDSPTLLAKRVSPFMLAMAVMFKMTHTQTPLLVQGSQSWILKKYMSIDHYSTENAECLGESWNIIVFVESLLSLHLCIHTFCCIIQKRVI